MTGKEFIYNKYPHLKHPLEGKNPVIDIELERLAQWLEEFRQAAVSGSLPPYQDGYKAGYAAGLEAAVEKVRSLRNENEIDNTGPRNWG